MYRLQTSLSLPGFLLVWVLIPIAVRAQEPTQPTLEIRPHCTQATECPAFDIRDPLSVQTPVLRQGDAVDIDIVLHNPERLPLSRFRIWLTYDPLLYTGGTLSVSDSFPTPTPGELQIGRDEGLIKLSGTAVTPVTDDHAVLARITLPILPPRVNASPLTFFDNAATIEPETGVFTVMNDTEINLIAPPHAFLFVRFASEDASDSVTSSNTSEESTLASSAISSASSATISEPETVFAMLRVQGLRITTEGSTVYVAWDTLPSSALVGYYLYYGTVPGTYIQRRAVDAAATSVALRALPEGTTYYAAIRGVNANGQETDFSQEVAVSVGNPRTSTSPFSIQKTPPVTPDTNGNVAGETGMASVAAILLLCAAAIGTVAAVRRQWVAR